MKVRYCFFIIFFPILSFAGISDCRKIKLDDLVFSVNHKKKLFVAPPDELRGTVITKRNVNVSRRNENVELLIQGSDGKVCKTIAFELDPLKLCRAGTQIESWSFITCPTNTTNCYPGAEPNYSIVSRLSKINSAKLRASRICGSTQLKGNVTVLDSFIGGSDNI